MFRYGHSIDEVGRSLSWSALYSFIKRLGIDSELGKDINPELHRFGSTLKTNAILADIYDLLAMINANLCALGSHKEAKKPKPYPRPFMQDDGDHYGNDAVEVPELRKFFADKRKR